MILVGRTGLEQSLRRDRRVELIRAREPLEAVGELADPIDESSPADSVVVVEPSPALFVGGACEARAFVAGLRRVDPDVRVVGVEAAGEPSIAGAFDACVPRDAAYDDLARVDVRASVPVRPEAGAPIGDAGDDSAMVSTLLAGRDVTDTGVRLIAARLGVGGVRLEPAGVQSDNVVRLGRRSVGRLVAPGADAGELARAVVWLEGWLRLAEQQRQLREAAFTDPLTGAWNRRYFDRFLSAAIERARAARRSLSLFVLDIDNFKVYNDRYGHAAGDEILRESVRLLRSVIRPTDRVCRIGGDEFAVIFDEPDGPRHPASRPPESVYVLARRCQREVCAHRFPKLGREAMGTLTISGGLATFPWDGQDPASLLERADELALMSKKQGKNAITLGEGAERLCGAARDEA